MIKKLYYLLVVSLLLVSTTIFANQDEPVKAAIISEVESAQPGQPFWLAIQINMDKEWHAYWKNPGDSGMPMDIEWELPPGFEVKNVEWPFPQRFNLGAMVGFGYLDTVWLLAEISPPASAALNSEVEIGANVNWLVCSDETCLPGSSSLKTKLMIKDTPPQKLSQHAGNFEAARSKLPGKQPISALRKDGLIELTWNSEHSLSFTEADFFPEHPDQIDHKVPPLLTPSLDDSGNLTIVLKEAESNDAANLKGVLVLKSEGKDAVAIAVEAPLQDDSSPVAYADIKSKSGTLEKRAVGQYEGGFALALVFAFIGGLILNLMPCVLPVISLKVFSFVKMAGQSRMLTLKHGIAFSAGVIISFWFLAVVMLVLQAYGQSVGWGFQLQEPVFVAFLAALLLVFGLSLFGVFEMGMSVTSLASKAQGQSAFGLLGSFCSGILATAVATPCTGPFLGSAVGFAFTLPPSLALLIFTSLGLGMASPYLVLAAYPDCMRFIPKPGPWMVKFKEIMGFFMFATVLWLLWVFGAETSSLGVILLLAAFFIISFGCWIFGSWATPVHKKRTRMIASAAALLCLCLAGSMIINTATSPLIAAAGNQKDDHDWQDFSAMKVADLQKKGKAVFVDFTAKWCLICQANHLVLTTPEVSKKFAELGVVLMKADWTKNDPKITEALRKFGRNGVPLYVLYSPDSDDAPIILPQVLTPDVVLEYLDGLQKQIADRKK